MEVEDRPAARALVVTPEREVLLMRVEVAPGRLVWITPGGGVDAGEEPRETAARELLEETGRALELGPAVWTREHTFAFEERLVRQRETFFLAPSERFEPRADGLEAIETRVFRGFRWWNIGAIRGSQERFAPRRLGELLGRLLEEGPPPQPIDVGV